MVTLRALPLNSVGSPLGLVWTAYVVAVPEGQGLDPTDVVIQEHRPIILVRLNDQLGKERCSALGRSRKSLEAVVLSVRRDRV